MASRFWVGGTGTWDTSTTTNWSTIDGGGGGASAPTINDDVFLTALSGGGTITTALGAICANLDTTGFTGTIALTTQSLTTTPTAGGNVKIGVGTAFSGTATLNVNGSGSGISTLTTNGVLTIPRINMVSATTATIQLADPLTVVLSIILTSGTFDTNNQAINCQNFNSDNSNTRTIKLGSSVITCTLAGAAWVVVITTGLTVTANTAQLTLNGASCVLRTGTINWNGLSVTFNGAASGSAGFGIDTASGTSPTFANITVLGNTGVGTSWLCVPNIIVTGTLTLTPDADTHRILVCRASSGPTNATTTITAAAVVASHVVDFMEMTGAGAATWTTAATGALYFGDCGGNSGITFTPSAQQTWQGTSGGNWSDVTKWTSRVPLPQDDVSFNGVAFTGGQTISQTMPRIGRSIDFTGVSGTPTMNGGGWFFGNLTLVAGMSLSTGSFAWLAQGRSAFTITTAGKIFQNSFTIDSIGGTYTIVGDFLTLFAFGFTHGNLVMGGNVSATSFTSSSSLARTLTFVAGSTWTLTASGSVWNIVGPVTFVNAQTTTLVFTDATASVKTFIGNSLSYGVVRFASAGGGGVTITGSNQFVSLDVEAPVARTLTLPASGVQVVSGGTLTFRGQPGQTLTIVSSSPGTGTRVVVADGSFFNLDSYAPSGDVTIITPTMSIPAGQSLGRAHL